MTERMALAALLLSLLLAACGSPPPRPPVAVLQAQQASQAAHRAMREGNLTQAREKFTQALWLQQSLDNHAAVATTILNLAVIEHRLGNDATALQQLDRLLLADALPYPQDLRVATALRKAVILVDGGDAKQAAITLELATGECALQCNHAPGIANTRARMALERGDHAVALQLAKSAMGIPGVEKEELANAHRMSGIAEFELGQYAAALNHYQAALELDKELGISKRIVADLNGLAKTLERLGRKPEADANARRAMAVSEATTRISGSTAKK